MSASVPFKRTEPAISDIIVSGPGRGRTWREATSLYHWIRAHGMQIIPAHYPGIYLTTATPQSVYYRMAPQGQAIARMWVIVLRQEEPSGAAAAAEVQVNFPSGAVATYRPTVLTGLALDAPRIFYEPLALADKTSVRTDLALSFERKTGSTAVTVECVSCFEVPRAVLTQDASDLGIDLETLRPGQPVFDIANESFAALVRNLAATWPRRSLLQQSFPEIEVDSSSWTDLFVLPIPVLPHKGQRNDSTLACKWDIRARVEDGTTNGELRITTGRSANQRTLPIGLGETAHAWLGEDDITLDAETTAVDDGLPGASDFETVQFAGRRTAGSGRLFIQSVAVWEPDVTAATNRRIIPTGEPRITPAGDQRIVP